MEENQKRSFKSVLFDFLKGITLGISAAIAGLSAGTIAVAEGCYDTLINAVSNLKKKFKESFFILLPYFVGLLFGAIVALIGIQRGYNAAPFSITSFFAGLVLGSLPVTFKELRKGRTTKEKTSHCLSFLLCLALAAGLGIITALFKWQVSLFGTDGSVAWYAYFLMIIAGIIGAFACVVPGISGSMSLMVIGLYYPILNAYTGTNSIWHSDNKITIILGILLVFLFAIGAVGGVIVGSKTMKYLLNKFRVTTFYGILGLILGSLVSMYINSSIFPLYAGVETNGVVSKIQTWDYIVGAVLFVLAAVGIFFLFKFLDKKKASEEA